MAAQGPSGVSSVMKGGNLLGLLKNPGDLEKEILKKGMTKSQAQKSSTVGYMNNQELI